MDRVTLITVEKTSCLRSERHPERCVLIVDPGLSIPPAGWEERTETATVLRPDGGEFEAIAQISVSHRNLKTEHRDLSIDQRWRVTISFPGLTSKEVPNGSKILVSHEIRDALLSKSEG